MSKGGKEGLKPPKVSERRLKEDEDMGRSWLSRQVGKVKVKVVEQGEYLTEMGKRSVRT